MLVRRGVGDITPPAELMITQTERKIAEEPTPLVVRSTRPAGDGFWDDLVGRLKPPE